VFIQTFARTFVTGGHPGARNILQSGVRVYFERERSYKLW